MKKFTVLAMVLIAGMALLTSCQKEGAKLYDVSIMVYYPEGYGIPGVGNLEVTIQNTLNGQELLVTTKENGIAKVSLEEGIYTISASHETDEFYFNGITENLTIEIERANNYWDIHMIASAKGGGLVIKEVYFSGSKTPTGSNYYSDQFHEIYNNSDEVLYLDGLCIGVLEPIGTSPSAWVNPDGSLMDRLPVSFHTLMFPGTGQQHPIQPRTSAVLAHDAIDHQTDPLGNPNSPVNMGDAPFEAFIEAPGKDTDSPEAANMIVVYTTSATMVDWLHSVNGAALIIFRLPTGLNHAAFAADPNNFMTKPGTTSTIKYLMVHKDWVIDGVDINRANEADRYKRLPTSIDAGMVWCSGTYNSKSVRRKVEKVLDGKAIYKDTNNSFNDFIGDWTPTPFIHPTVVD